MAERRERESELYLQRLEIEVDGSTRGVLAAAFVCHAIKKASSDKAR